MKEFYPLLIIGAIVGVLSLCFVVAYAMMKNKKEAIGFDRNMKDGEIARRLLRYAKPHIGKFVFVGIVMLFSIAYDIISPLLVGEIEEMVKETGFPLNRLFLYVGVYAAILLSVSLCAIARLMSVSIDSETKPESAV